MADERSQNQSGVVEEESNEGNQTEGQLNCHGLKAVAIWRDSYALLRSFSSNGMIVGSSNVMMG